jgi:hypothetical protein
MMNERVPWQGWRRKGEDAGLPAAKGAGSRRPFASFPSNTTVTDVSDAGSRVRSTRLTASACGSANGSG